jgi:hypothetical protein
MLGEELRPLFFLSLLPQSIFITPPSFLSRNDRERSTIIPGQPQGVEEFMLIHVGAYERVRCKLSLFWYFLINLLISLLV